MHKEFKIIALSITTYCNMKCPDCCAGMQSGVAKSHVDWDYMVNAAKYFKGVETIDLCGGEATMHPKFQEWSPKLKELFECKYLTVDTNASMFRVMPDIFTHFDKIYTSVYPKGFYKDWKGNTENIEFLLNTHPEIQDKLYISGEITHIPRSVRNNGIPCERATSGTIRYEDGRLYPCCTGSGIDTLVSIPLTENWRTEINEVKPPCGDCFLAL